MIKKKKKFCYHTKKNTSRSGEKPQISVKKLFLLEHLAVQTLGLLTENSNLGPLPW